MQKAQTRLSIVMLLMPLAGLLAACQHTVTTPPAACSRLIPEAWTLPVPPVPLPDFTDVGEVLTAFIGQTAQLDKANGRPEDIVHIFTTCELMHNEARPRERFLGIF